MDCNVQIRPLSDYDGRKREEIVFNYTDCDYFSMVSPDEVSSHNNPGICFRTSKYDIPLEVRSVDVFYREKCLVATLVRIEPYFNGERCASFGREIANCLSEYFGDTILREGDIPDLHKNGIVDFSEFGKEYNEYHAGENPYMLCFRPSYQSKAYYYPATVKNSYSGIQVGAPCPYGVTEEDTSKVNKEKIHDLEKQISFLKSEINKIESLPTKIEKPIFPQKGYCNDFDKEWEEYDKKWSEVYKFNELLEKRRIKIDKLQVSTSKQGQKMLRSNIEKIEIEMQVFPFFDKLKELDINWETQKNKNEEVEQMKSQINELEWDIRKENFKSFTKPAVVCRDTCRDCPLFDLFHSTNSMIACRMTPIKGLPSKTTNQPKRNEFSEFNL